MLKIIQGFTKWILEWISEGRTKNIKNFDLFFNVYSILNSSKHQFYMV